MSHRKHIDFEVPGFGELAAGPALQPGYESEVAGDAPAAWWKLSEASGPTAANSGSLPGIDGAYTAGCTLGQPGPLVRCTAKAVLLDGLNGRIDGAAGLNGYHGGRCELTLEAWARPGSTSAGNHVVAGWWYATAFALHRNGNAWRLAFRDQAGWGSVSLAAAVTVGQWQHLAVRVSAAEALARLLINGLPVASAAFTGPLYPGTEKFTIGAYQNAPSYLFDGALAQVAVYDRALPAERLLAHYRAGKAL